MYYQYKLEQNCERRDKRDVYWIIFSQHVLKRVTVPLAVERLSPNVSSATTR